MHFVNPKQVKDFVDTGNYDLLLSFTGFDLKSIGFIRIIENAKNNIQKHVLDNCIDINTSLNDGMNWTIINHMCREANDEMLKYIIDIEGVDLEHSCGDGWRPIHQLCHYKKNNSELVKHLISKGVDLFCKNDNGNTPLEFFCKNNDSSVIIFAVNRVQNIAKELVDKMCDRLEEREYFSNNQKEELKQLINSKVI